MDIYDGDLELWDTDLDTSMQETLKMSTDSDMQEWFLERDSKLPHVILNDKLMTDAILVTLPIKTEHSYSLNSDGDSMPDSPGSLQNKMDDMDDECYPAITMNQTNNNNNTGSIVTRHHIQTYINNNLNNSNSSNLQNNVNSYNAIHPTLQQQNAGVNHQQHLIQNNNHLIINNNLTSKYNHNIGSPSSTMSSDLELDDTTVKEEPLSPSSSCPPSPNSQHDNNYTISTVNLANVAAYTQSDLVFEHKQNGSLQLSPASQSLLKNQQIVINNGNHCSNANQQKVTVTKLNIKMEPQTAAFGLPPTPPSSLPSDESEGNQSPEHHISPMSPPSSTTSTSSSRRTSVNSSPANSKSNSSSNTGTRQPIHTPLISSQPKGSTGQLVLTEEEKRTLIAEGYPIPTRLPLTKAEEKSLKKIRRKIKNKISAQESRRKKKEYMDQLERKVEILVSENLDYRKRVESLEDSNANLLSQLSKLQAMINRQNFRKS